MARFDPRTITLRDGSAVTIRSAEPDDAAAVLDHMADHDATAPFPVTLADERDMDEPRKREWIGKRLEAPAALVLLITSAAAPTPRGVVGAIHFEPGAKRRLAHDGLFGVSAHSAWQGRGVGTALVTAMLDWAAAHPTIEKVSLQVVSSNVRAIALYRRLGFVEEGRRARAIKYGPGEYADDILMARFVKPL